MKLLAKPSWEKEELPQSVTLRDGTQQDLLQVTPMLALRPRDRGGSGDTWRNRSRPSRESSGRPGRDQGSPDPGGVPAPYGGGCWSGEGLEIGRRGSRWTVGKPRPTVRGGPGCARGRKRDDSWAVVERPQDGGDWFLATPPRSTLRAERVPVSSGWGLGILSRIGEETHAGTEKKVVSPPG